MKVLKTIDMESLRKNALTILITLGILIMSLGVYMIGIGHQLGSAVLIAGSATFYLATVVLVFKL